MSGEGEDLVEAEKETALGEATTKEELRGWYIYDAANSVYSGVAMSAFLPLLLRDTAKMAAGFPANCPNLITNLTMIYSVFNDSSLDAMHRVQSMDPLYDDCTETTLCKDGYCQGEPWYTADCRTADGSAIYPLDVELLGVKIDPTAYATSFISISVIFQTIAFLSCSALADYGKMRKKALIWFSLMGSFFTVLCVGVNGDTFWLGAICIVLSNVGYGTGIVFYNSYLPLLAQNHREVLSASPEKRLDVRAKVEDRISSYGFFAGYFTTVLLLLVCIPIALFVTDSVLAYQINIGLAGVWWFVFSLYTFRTLKERPGPPLPEGAHYLTHGWAKSWDTAKKTRRDLKETYKFLLCWFFYSDSYALMAAIGALFATEEVDWGCFSPTVGVTIMFLLIPLMAGLGGVFYEKYLRQKKDVENKTIILINLVMYVAMTLYGCIGFFTDEFGLKKGWEIVFFGAMYGFNLGSIQSYSRALFSSFIPKGMEANLFGFFEVTDKGSSWLGPMVAALLKQYFRNTRFVFIYMAFGLGIPAYFLWTSVDVKKGMKEAAEYNATGKSGDDVESS